MVTHKITYDIIEGTLIPGRNPLMPVIRVYSDGMGYGKIRFNIPETGKSDSLTAQIYKVNTPHIDDERWIRTGSDLFDSSILDFNGLLVNSTTYSIEFQFLPGNISGLSDGDYYSIEFYVSLDQSIDAVFSVKLIISIQNRFK
jgi:hypothetical protein